jgi:hypothetical protein
VALAQFVLAVLEQLDERAIDVAEAEEAQVVGVNGKPLVRKRNSAPKGAMNNMAITARLMACPFKTIHVLWRS